MRKINKKIKGEKMEEDNIGSVQLENQPTKAGSNNQQQPSSRQSQKRRRIFHFNKKLYHISCYLPVISAILYLILGFGYMDGGTIPPYLYIFIIGIVFGPVLFVLSLNTGNEEISALDKKVIYTSLIWIVIIISLIFQVYANYQYMIQNR